MAKKETKNELKAARELGERLVTFYNERLNA